MDAQRWGLAAEAYQQIYELGQEVAAPRAPVALWDMGLALMHIPGREADARDAFQRFLDQSTTLTDDPQVRDWRSTALEHIAELNARIGPAESDTTAEPTVDPEELSAPLTGGDQISPAGPVILGVAGALFIASAVTGGLALAEHDDITSMCDAATMHCPPELQPRADELATLSTATDVLLATAAASAILGLVLTLVLHEHVQDDATVSAGCTSTGCTAAFRTGF